MIFGNNIQTFFGLCVDFDAHKKREHKIGVKREKESVFVDKSQLKSLCCCESLVIHLILLFTDLSCLV